jgi:hypothetical protein
VAAHEVFLPPPGVSGPGADPDPAAVREALGEKRPDLARRHDQALEGHQSG